MIQFILWLTQATLIALHITLLVSHYNIRIEKWKTGYYLVWNGNNVRCIWRFKAGKVDNLEERGESKTDV